MEKMKKYYKMVLHAHTNPVGSYSDKEEYLCRHKKLTVSAKKLADMFEA